ncbi:unnamed protein product [Prorocentrum cordatum]|uniref:Uncharacterized protein n=1 Tax=Prorocentrum cordatum TaxID=2364126 RepID=A0ABN9Y8F5_9DINO|nr:unnamed protein product [Polarella glacialis]CAK0908642.1 unnamed protein product [Polarella glacialis]
MAASSGGSGESCNGVLCRFSACTAGGNNQSAAWKAYATEPGETELRWQILRFLPNVGYTESGKKRYWRHISDNFTRWEALLQLAQLDAPANIGRSLKSIHYRQEVDQLDDANADHWVTSAALLCLLASWVNDRRRLDIRSQCRAILVAFLQKTVPVEAVSNGPLLELRPSTSCQAACRRLPIVDDRCLCLQQLVASAASGPEQVSPQARVADKLVVLQKESGTCAAARRWFQETLQALQHIVDDAVHLWGDFDWHKGSDAKVGGEAKRRRLDPHVKVMALHTAVADGSQATGAASARAHGIEASEGVKIMKSEQACYQCACHLSAASSQQIAVCVDGARMGKPSREMLLGALSCVDTDAHFILPPQELAGIPGPSRLRCQGPVKQTLARAQQVLKDYHETAGKDAALLSEERREALQASQALKLKKMFQAELSERESRQLDMLDTELGYDQMQRKANLAWMRALDNMLRAGCGKTLSDFVPRRRLAALGPGERREFVNVQMPDGSMELRSVIQKEDGVRCFELPRVVVANRRVHRIMHIALDQGSTGLPSLLWLALGKGLRCTVTWDLFHRLHNDMAEALALAGLTVIRLEFYQVLKMRKGPWNGDGNWNVLRGAAREMKTTLKADNALFEFLYEDLVQSRPALRNRVDVGSAEHLEASWRYVCDELRSIGEAAQFKWVDLMGLMYVGFKRKWWNFANNPLLGDRALLEDAGDEALPGEGEAEVDGDLAADHGGEPDAAEHGPSDEKLSMEAARKVVTEKRKHVAQILQFAGLTLANSLKCRLWQGMAHLPQPLEDFVGAAVVKVKTKQGLVELHRELTGGVLVEVARDILLKFVSSAFHEACEFKDRVAPTKREKDEDMSVLSCLWVYACRLCGEILKTQQMFWAPPMCFLPLVDSEPDAVNACLASLQKSWEALLRLETAACADKKCKTFVDGLLAPRMQFVREAFVRLAETGFKWVPDDLREWLHGMLASFLSSLLNELMAKKGREVASKNTSKRIDPCTLYHSLSLGSHLLEDFERSPVPITGAARAASAGNVPTGSFLLDCDADFSLSQADEDAFTSKEPDWPNVGPRSIRLGAVAWQLMLSTDGDWRGCDLGFLNLLVQPGSLIIEEGSGQAKLALASTPFGFVAYRTKITQAMWLEFAPVAKESCMFGRIVDPSKWKASSVAAKLKPADLDGGVPAAMCPMFAKESGHLLTYAARRGFKGMTVAHMLRLFDYLDVATRPKPRAEVPLLHALVAHVLQEKATQGVLKEALLRRHETDDLPARLRSQVSEVLGPEFEEDVEEELMDDRDIKQQCEELKAARARAEVKQKKNMAAATAMIPAFPPPPAPATAGPAGGRKRKFTPVPATGLSKEEGQALLPPGCTFSKDLKENRWRMKSPHLVGALSKSYGPASALDDYGAMLYLVLKAWKEEGRVNEVECPFEFEGAGHLLSLL